MTKQLIHTVHGSAAFDYATADTAAVSAAAAIASLAKAAEATRASVVWSSLRLNFEVATIEDRTFTAEHPTILPGAATVHASAESILNTGGTP